VIRIRRSLEILQVATDARCVLRRQVVVVVDMALRALHGRVRTAQGKSSGRVIERRARPGRRVMALGAGLGEAGLHVIRIRRALEVLQVTANARCVGTGQVVVVVDMALRAGNCRMCPSQRESSGRVIERRVRPRDRIVALLTSLREAGLHVVRVRRSLEVRQVAVHA